MDFMLQQGFNEPAQIKWNSSVVLVPKPDESLRFCIDYRWPNAISIRDTYPIPGMQYTVDSLGEATWISTLDADSGHWQVPMAEGDQDKITFTYQLGAYRF